MKVYNVVVDFLVTADTADEARRQVMKQIIRSVDNCLIHCTSVTEEKSTSDEVKCT